jgi:outer membrane protein OmpA-like peptidoglycan-associated protein
MKGFKYDKFKEEANSSDAWGSYSDLFMVLSFVFLMMYVVASLKSGTSSIQQRLERQQIARDNDDLRSQIKAYNTLKDSALQEESKDEQEVYTELMDKLSLLQEEAKDEKNNLRRQALENEKKEVALNKYQQVVRNIINANLLAKNKLKVREEIIENKNQEIGDLSEELVVKKSEIEQNNKQISKINRDLAKNISDLEKAQKTSKITREKAYEQIARLKKKSIAQIQELNQENQEVQSRLTQINQELSKTSEKLVQTETVLATTTDTLNKAVTEYESQIDDMKSTHAQKMAGERAAFENKIKAAKLTAAQKAQQLAEFNRKAKEKDQAVGRQIASLQGELTEAEARENAKAQENAALSSELTKTSQKLNKTVGDYEGQIKGMQAAHEQRMAKEKAALEGKIAAANMSAQEKAKQLAEFNRQNKEKSDALGKQIAGLKGDLAAAQTRANARMKLSKEIAKALKDAGVSADVNPNTGDVTIAFNGDYFDNGSSDLKPTMANVLQKFIPKYSESLFKDANIANKITSVDIVGFASPTYQNKYIDPQSLDPQDQKAAKYNLDLSYKRARSIFDYMFDTNKINYKNQKQLLPLVKVTGRSFFTEGRAPSGAIPGMSQKEFCRKFDCKQSQKVIIKFNMDDKK